MSVVYHVLYVAMQYMYNFFGDKKSVVYHVLHVDYQYISTVIGMFTSFFTHDWKIGETIVFSLFPSFFYKISATSFFVLIFPIFWK